MPTTEFACDIRSLRIYSVGEQQELGVECLSIIIFLETAGVITPALRELIIERGIALQDDPVPLGKFKIIVLMVLWSLEQSLEPLIIEECFTKPIRDSRTEVPGTSSAQVKPNSFSSLQYPVSDACLPSAA